MSMMAEVDFESLGHGAGADNAADVRGNNHQVVVLAFDEVVEKNRGGVDVVDGMSKKPWIWSAWRSIVRTRSTPTA